MYGLLLLWCACASLSVVTLTECVRYDGGGNGAARPIYVEYQDGRAQDGDRTRVITFPQSADGRAATTRRPSFPDEPAEETPPDATACCAADTDHYQIPLELIMQLNEVRNVSELWEFVNTEAPVDGSEPPQPSYGISNRFGGPSGMERSAAVIPKPATCMPELTTVPLVSEDVMVSGVFYFPSCTRVKRCGGCCSHSLLSCQPVQTEQLSFQIIKSEFSGGSKLSYSGKEIIVVEQHTKCKCDCIVKPEHCNQFQEYRKNECRCACTNTDDEHKCQQENALKLWDPHSCVCRCRETLDCTTGSFFDQSTCQCAQIPSRTLGPGADRMRFKVKPIPIVQREDEIYEV